MDPFEAVFGERERVEERRARAEGVCGRADVVNEARQGQLGRAHTAAYAILRLNDEDGLARLRQHDGRRQPVRARSDDNRVV